MKYFAFEGGVCQYPKDGAIEISLPQYTAAVKGMSEGHSVSVAGGSFTLITNQEPEPDGGDTELTPEERRARMPTLERVQVLLALDAQGITEEMVDEKLADDRQGMIEWKNRLRYRRDHHLIDLLGAEFGLAPEQIDALWEQATEF